MKWRKEDLTKNENRSQRTFQQKAIALWWVVKNRLKRGYYAKCTISVKEEKKQKGEKEMEQREIVKLIEKLEAIRIANGLSNGQFAIKIGTSRQYWWRLANEPQSANPSLKFFLKAAKAFNKSLDDLGTWKLN